MCVFRLYVHPAEDVTAQQVLDDLSAGKIANLSVLKLRLWTALDGHRQGVKLADVWDAVHRHAPDAACLARRIGWPVEHLAALDTYRNCPDRYFFPSVAQVRHAFCTSPGGFECLDVHVPSYSLGEQCPTLVFRRL
jgi:hypothetical protein